MSKQSFTRAHFGPEGRKGIVGSDNKGVADTMKASAMPDNQQNTTIPNIAIDENTLDVPSAES